MTAHLRVDTDHAFDISLALIDDGEELRDQPRTLAGEWGGLAAGWSGAAATAYQAIWAEWHHGALALVETWTDWAHRLGVC